MCNNRNILLNDVKNPMCLTNKEKNDAEPVKETAFNFDGLKEGAYLQGRTFKNLQ